MWNVCKPVFCTSAYMCVGGWIFLCVYCLPTVFCGRGLIPVWQLVWVCIFGRKLRACSGTLSLAIIRLCCLHTLPAPSWIIHPFGWSNIHLLFILPPWCQATRAATSLWNLKGAPLWAHMHRFSWLTVCNTLQRWPLWGDLHKLKRNVSSQCSFKIKMRVVERENQCKSKLRFSDIFELFSDVLLWLWSTVTLFWPVTFWSFVPHRQLHVQNVCWLEHTVLLARTKHQLNDDVRKHVQYESEEAGKGCGVGKDLFGISRQLCGWQTPKKASFRIEKGLTIMEILKVGTDLVLVGLRR